MARPYAKKLKEMLGSLSAKVPCPGRGGKQKRINSNLDSRHPWNPSAQCSKLLIDEQPICWHVFEVKIGVSGIGVFSGVSVVIATGVPVPAPEVTLGVIPVGIIIDVGDSDGDGNGDGVFPLSFGQQ